jgi:mannose-6-phosphate isomerase
MRKFTRHYVEKPWGRTDLPQRFDPPAGRIGEIWFEDGTGTDLPLLAKYIFTSETLSIQVHPDDAQARLAGEPRGKSECWYILDCEEGATIGIGLTEPLTTEAFACAVTDGRIEQYIDWKPVQPGDFFYIPAGTVHAIGGGIQLIEVQQNCDITYRLFDFGRPRALHLAEGTAVSRLIPYDRSPAKALPGQSVRLLDRDEAPFSLDVIALSAGETLKLPDTVDLNWFLPVSGAGLINDEAWGEGDCWVLDGYSSIVAHSDSRIVLATATR